MKKFVLSSLLLYLSAVCIAQDTADTISTIRVKKNRKQEGIEGIATVGGMYYGRMQVDEFLRHEHLNVSQDNGRWKIVSFSSAAIIKGRYTGFSQSASFKIPADLKAALKDGGSIVYFENITAVHEDGTTVTLNPIIIKLYDVAAGAPAASPHQSNIRAIATVAGIRDGKLHRDSLLKYDGILILGDEPGAALISYDVQFAYKGTLFTMTSAGPLPADLKKLLLQPQGKISRLTFENIKIKRAAGGPVVLNPVVIRLPE